MLLNTLPPTVAGKALHAAARALREGGYLAIGDEVTKTARRYYPEVAPPTQDEYKRLSEQLVMVGAELEGNGRASEPRPEPKDAEYRTPDQRAAALALQLERIDPLDLTLRGFRLVAESLSVWLDKGTTEECE